MITPDVLRKGEASSPQADATSARSRSPRSLSSSEETTSASLAVSMLMSIVVFMVSVWFCFGFTLVFILCLPQRYILSIPCHHVKKFVALRHEVFAAGWFAE